MKCPKCGCYITTADEVKITRMPYQETIVIPAKKGGSAWKWILGIALALFAIMIFTKPEKEKHVEKISELLMEVLQKQTSTEENEMAKNLTMMMAPSKVKSYVEANTYIDDYIIFNVGHIKGDGEEKTATIGIFNNAFLLLVPKEDYLQ